MTPTSRAPLVSVPANVPLVLLPVRLETRIEPSGTTMALLVRVYPDDLHADSHDERLTAAEVAWGQHFWTQTWRAGDSAARRRAAWGQLAQQFGGPRASYIAEQLRPTNQDAMPASPVPDDEALPVTPVFPETTTRPNGWSRAARTRVLPDCWVAVVYAAGQRFVQVGSPIDEELALGPALDAPSPDFDPLNLAKDPQAGWLVDFAMAESKGMALRVACNVPSTTMVDRVLVFGAKTSSTEAGAALLEEVLGAHRFASGVAFVPQGTPTNNTVDAPSGYTSLESGYTGGVLADAVIASVEGGAGSNAETTARALGVDPGLLTPLEYGGLEEQRDAYHMNTALWRATWGYFLEQLVAGQDAPFTAGRQVREHFSSLVRARGPLPVVRVNAQAYGLLPVVSLDRWQHQGDALDQVLPRVLRALRDIWRRALPSVPRVVLGAEDSAGELLKVLAMQPVSVSVGVREALPIVSIGPMPVVTSVGSDALRQLAQDVGIDWVPRQLRTLVAPWPFRRDLAVPLVQAAPAEGLAPNYVAWLSTAAWTDVRRPPDGARADSVLYMLLRHATLREYADAAHRLLVRRGLATSEALREVETAGTSAATPWTLLSTALSDLGDIAAGSYLDAARAQLVASGGHDAIRPGTIWQRDLYRVDGLQDAPAGAADDLSELAAFARSLAYLAGRPPAALTRVLAETIDLCSHRIDAWMTSLATKRLETLRQQMPRGIVVGGYGWIENIQRTTRTMTVPPALPPGTPLPPELASPLYSSNSFGYVQAPSLGHATTAAILRSGYLSRWHSRDGDALGVNLGSRRMRTVQWLLGGIRSSQPLGALLGYRFERGLHENHPADLLDPYIETFRTLAPLPGVQRPPLDAGPQESIAPRTVVDGLALVRRYRDALRAGATPSWTSETIPFGEHVSASTVPLPPPQSSNAHFAAILAELQALDDAIDAMGDVTLAEAVHQMAQGNIERARAALEAITLGEAPPPDLEVIETPRTGIAVTHRLVVLFDRTPQPSWGAATPRSQAEPRLAAWTAELLGPSAPTASCRVTYVDADTGTLVSGPDGSPSRTFVGLRDLALSPLDVVYAQGIEGDASLSEIARRIEAQARRAVPDGVRPAHVPAAAAVRLALARESDWPAGMVGIAEVLEVARAVQRLLASARPVSVEDLTWPPVDRGDVDAEPANGEAVEDPLVRELGARTDTAVTAFGVCASALSGIASADEKDFNSEEARRLLLDASRFGVSGAVPLAQVDDGPDALTASRVQAVSVAREMRERVRTIERLRPGGALEGAKYHLERMKEVFGESFRVLPQTQTPDAAPLTTALEGSVSLQGGNTTEAIAWLQRAARVRDGAARFDRAMMYAEAFGGAPLRLAVAQLPYASGDRWVALPRAEGVPGGILSLVVQGPASLDLSASLSGLVVDEWVEVVPQRDEMTGVTFHYDRPNARAPQSILLAVAPDDRPVWDVETLEATLLETLEWAKLRTVDQQLLTELDAVLPAVYLAQPGLDETVTTNTTPAPAPPASETSL